MAATFSSLRVRFVVMVLLALLPAAAVIYYSAADRRDDSGNKVRAQTLQLATTVAGDYSRSLDSTREFLLPLGQLLGLLPNLENLTEAACAPTFGELIENNHRVLSISAALPDGTVVCGNVPGQNERANIAEEPFFQQAVDRRDLGVSGLTTDRPTGKPTINVGYPVIGVDGSIHGVIFAGLDLTVLSESVGARQLPDGSFVTLRSQSGTIVARYPEPDRWVGQTAAGSSSLLPPESTGRTSEGTSLDGTPVLYASAPVASLSSTGTLSDELGQTVASVGIPKSVAYAGLDSRLRNDLLALLAVGVLAAAGAWLGSSLILRKLGTYVGVTNRFAAGDLNARTGPSYPRNEIGALGRAFDDMATAITQREKEIRALNEGLEQRVAERTAALEAANQELESFSYSVSHDLRAPLRSIDGFSRIIVEEHAGELSEESLGLFQRVRNSAQQMGQLVDGLLTFSRLGRRAISTTTVDMKRLVQEAYDGLAPDPGDRRVDFTLGELPPCEGDAGLLKHVVTNLLENALKFTRGRDVAQIEVGSERREATVYYVHDNGAGFDMRYADKLFGVFQRLHRADQFEGTGVGLAIVHRILTRHGGRIWADSSPGVGTTFYFTIGSGEVHAE